MQLLISSLKERLEAKHEDGKGEGKLQPRRGNGVHLNGMNGFLNEVFWAGLHASPVS